MYEHMSLDTGPCTHPACSSSLSCPFIFTYKQLSHGRLGSMAIAPTHPS